MAELDAPSDGACLNGEGLHVGPPSRGGAFRTQDGGCHDRRHDHLAVKAGRKQGSLGIDVGDSGLWLVGGGWNRDRSAGEHERCERGGGVDALGARRVLSRALLFGASVRPWLMPSRIAWRIASRWRRIVSGRAEARSQAAA